MKNSVVAPVIGAHHVVPFALTCSFPGPKATTFLIVLQLYLIVIHNYNTMNIHVGRLIIVIYRKLAISVYGCVRSIDGYCHDTFGWLDQVFYCVDQI